MYVDSYVSKLGEINEHTELNRLETEKNGLATEEEQSDYDESTLAPFKEKVEKIKELIGDYDSTNQMLIDKDNEIQDKINEELEKTA